MDLEVLKKKISTFRGDGGRVRITDEGLLMEILFSWKSGLVAPRISTV